MGNPLGTWNGGKPLGTGNELGKPLGNADGNGGNGGIAFEGAGLPDG